MSDAGRGIGIDIIEIARIKKSATNPRFLSRVFGAEELALYRERGQSPSFLAANFCAKEAFSKAVGTGVRGFELCEVQLLRDCLGKPYLSFSGAAARLVISLGLSFETTGIAATAELTVVDNVEVSDFARVAEMSVQNPTAENEATPDTVADRDPKEILGVPATTETILGQCASVDIVFDEDGEIELSR